MTDEEIQMAVSQREQARQIKDWSSADAIRERLRARGVQVRWRRAFGHSRVQARGGLPLIVHQQRLYLVATEADQEGANERGPA